MPAFEGILPAGGGQQERPAISFSLKVLARWRTRWCATIADCENRHRTIVAKLMLLALGWGWPAATATPIHVFPLRRLDGVQGVRERPGALAAAGGRTARMAPPPESGELAPRKL